MTYSKEIRVRAGLKQKELAALAGTSTVYLSQIESGVRNASDAMNNLLCMICKTYEDKKLSSEVMQAESAQKPAQTIPVVAMAAAAHFDPALSNLCDLWECTDERIACACAHADELFGIRISGDSMSPALLDGDVVAVSDRLPATGDTCIALHRTDGILCKRWFWKNGIIRLESINPEGRTYEWTKAEFTAEQPLTWRFKVEALIYRKL